MTSHTSSISTPTRLDRSGNRLPKFDDGFQERVDAIKPAKADLNLLILDYLITNGYPSAAKRFASEASIRSSSEDACIEERVAIRQAILEGDIPSAIQRINELSANILDNDPALHFALLRLQLIELIRVCITDSSADLTAAIQFATEHLAPRASTGTAYLDDLEKTMAVLIFPPDKLTPQLQEFMQPAFRKGIAERVNEAVLKEFGAPTGAKLRDLVRLRSWVEKELREKNPGLQRMPEYGLEETAPADVSQQLREDSESAEDPEAMVL